MVQYFNTDIAKKLGLYESLVIQLILNNLADTNNPENEIIYHDGRFWTRISVKTMHNQMPYLSAKQINSAIKKLEEADMVESSCLSKNKYDRTRWYSVKHLQEEK